MKIAYLGYDVLFDCLSALEQAGCSVLEIFTCPTDNRFEFNTRIRAFAADRAIPCTLRPIATQDLRRLRKAGCQAVFCAGYFFKVPVDDQLPVVNVHPSLLPQGRGAWPMPVQILRGMTSGGVTLHKMTAEWDAGDILLQQSFPIRPADDLETVTANVCRVAAGLCTQAIARFDELFRNAVPQGNGEYWPCPRKADYTITEQTTPEQADRILRAFYGFDCYLKTAETEHMIVRGRFSKMTHDRPFGDVERTERGMRYYVNGGVICAPNREEPL
ncbi:hypothetical protein Ruko_12250 [Ruthenibacterium sp. TH_2024_36131]|uniref:formyltransferase family protein n=1 Tax=Owariibacterium komagatae TaxID=3136601 RepID=UPI0038B2B23E